jgi:hypothetical protein
MASLGQLGKARAPQPVEVEPVTFDWFDLNEAAGNAVRLADEFNQVELIDLMDVARTLDANDPSAVAIIKDGFHMVVHPDDFDAFWAEARRNRQTIEDLTGVLTALFEAATDRPTQRQPDSSAGLPATVANSQVVSSSAVSSGPVEPAHRPDLVLLLQGGQETKQRLAAAVAAG